MGFIVPPESMVPWFGWFWRINPLAYTYESLMLNEVLISTDWSPKINLRILKSTLMGSPRCITEFFLVP